MEKIEQMLWNLTSDELSKICKSAEITGRSGNKDIKIKKLLEFYNSPNWIEEVFEKLPEYEKEMMECIIQNKYHPQYEFIYKITKKHKVNTYYSNFERDSKANVFYIQNRNIPEEFKVRLNKLVEPLKIEMKPIEEKINVEDFYEYIIERENRTQDFDEFIKYINVNKIKSTKAKCQMPKSEIIKIHEKLKYKDVLRTGEIEFEFIRNIEDTTVSFAIMELLTACLIIGVEDGYFMINELFCKDYQRLNKVEKIKYLLNQYLKEDNISINEIPRLQKRDFHIQNSIPTLGNARKIIIKYIKQCPIDKWVNAEQLKKAIRLNEYEFLRKYTGDVLVKDAFESDYYDEATHEEFENAFIDYVLIEFLATMGIVDVVMSKELNTNEYNEYLEVDYFKLTKFGSYVLNIAEYIEENPKINEDDIIITDDFKIIIGQTKRKLEYELYFDKFLNKISEEPLTYSLDFDGMVKALELGIKFKEIYEFLDNSSKKNIPENVKTKLKEWMRDSRKIKIKTLTVLEVDKDCFNDIISNSEFSKYIDSVNNNLIVIKNGKALEIKKALNKNGRFCV